MKHSTLLSIIVGFAFTIVLKLPAAELSPASPSAAATPPKVPAFSVDYMDRSVNPGTDFYTYAKLLTWLCTFKSISLP